MGLFVNNITGSFKDDNYIGITGSVKFGDPGFNGQATHLPAAPVGATFFVSGAKGSANYGILKSKAFSAFGGDLMVSGAMFLGDRTGSGASSTAYAATMGLAGGAASLGSGLSAAKMHTDDVMLFVATGSVHVMMKNGNQFALLSGSDGNSPAAGANTQVQYNANGTLAGADNLTFDGTDIQVGTADGDAKLEFRDGGNYIYSPTDGKLTVQNNDGTASDSIVINARTGGMQLKVADEKDLYMQNEAGDAFFVVAASATAGDEDVRIVNTNGTDGKSIEILSSAGGVAIECADEKDVYIGNDEADCYVMVAASATAGNEDIRLVNTRGTDEAAIAVTATAGGVDIDAAAGKDVNVAGGQVAVVSKDDAAGAISMLTNVGTSETITITNTQGEVDGSDAAGSILLSAAAGGIGLAWADGKDLWAEGGRAVITANEDAADCIKLHADAGSSQTINVVNDAGEGAGAIALTSTAGGVAINAAAGKIAGLAGGQCMIASKTDQASAIALMANIGSSETIVVTNTQGTAAGAISLVATAGGILLDQNSATKKVHIDSEGSVDIDAVAGLSIDCDGAAANFTVTADATGEDLTIAQDGSVDASVHISSAGTGADAITMTTSAGGIDITVAGAGAGEDLDISCNQEIRVTSTSNAAEAIILEANGGTSETIKIYSNQSEVDGAAAAGSILLASDDGGIGLSWADGKDLWAEGGRAVVTANEDAAECIKLHADAGASQTIVLVNDAGTDNAAIAVTTTAGGITLTTNASKNITVSSNAIVPASDEGVDLGTSSVRFGNIYTGDLHLSNDRGNWSLVEENNMITFRNNYTGKWFRMVMEEIDPTGRDSGMKGAPQGAHRDEVMWDL